jgi:hypothetical protein
MQFGKKAFGITNNDSMVNSSSTVIAQPLQVLSTFSLGFQAIPTTIRSIPTQTYPIRGGENPRKTPRMTAKMALMNPIKISRCFQTFILSPPVPILIHYFHFVNISSRLNMAVLTKKRTTSTARMIPEIVRRVSISRVMIPIWLAR